MVVHPLRSQPPPNIFKPGTFFFFFFFQIQTFFFFFFQNVLLSPSSLPIQPPSRRFLQTHTLALTEMHPRTALRAHARVQRVRMWVCAHGEEGPAERMQGLTLLRNFEGIPTPRGISQQLFTRSYADVYQISNILVTVQEYPSCRIHLGPMPQSTGHLVEGNQIP